MSVKIRKETFQGIPYLVYEGDETKRLIFIQHGIYGNKEKSLHLMGVKIADAGYMVVGVDARMHGDRVEPPFEAPNFPHGEMKMPEIIEPTATDILKLFDHVFTSFETFDYLGISMGGIIGYHLLTIAEKVDHFYGVITTPDYRTLIENVDEAYEKEYATEIAAAHQVLDRIDPAKRFSEMTFKSIHMFHGTLDTTVPIHGVKQFLNDHVEAPISLKIYETDHHITKAMLEDVLEAVATANK